jgi:hypothetical protein
MDYHCSYFPAYGSIHGRSSHFGYQGDDGNGVLAQETGIG